MQEKKKWIIGIILAVLVIGTAAVCYYLVNQFDAQSYVQAVLDASYKKKTKEYVEITGVSQKEAKQLFEEKLNLSMENFEASTMSEEMTEKYRELFKSLAENVNYTVGDAEKEKKGCYNVTVSVKPLTLFQDTYDTFHEKAKEYAVTVSNSVMQGEDMPSDEEMKNQVYEIYYEVLSESMEAGLNYGEERTLQLKVEKNNKGQYEINQKNLQELDSLLIEDAPEENE